MRDRIEPRDLDEDELADIATLRLAKQVIEAARVTLLSLPQLGIKVDTTPDYISIDLEWMADKIAESIAEIERIPELEAEREEEERG